MLVEGGQLCGGFSASSGGPGDNIPSQAPSVQLAVLHAGVFCWQHPGQHAAGRASHYTFQRSASTPHRHCGLVC